MDVTEKEMDKNYPRQNLLDKKLPDNNPLN